MRKRKPGRGLAVILLCSMVFLATQPVYATPVSDLEKQKEELEKQKKDADSKKKQEQQKYENAAGAVTSIQSDVDEVAGEIEEIDAALVETIASVEMIQEDIKAKEKQIEETTADYEKAQRTEREQYEAMKLRIRFMYEKGEISYLQLLLESESFGDLMNKAEYVERLYDYDRKLLEEYQAAREAVAVLKQKLEEELSELETQKLELEEEKKSLEMLLTQKQEQYENYEVQLARAKQEAAVYKANIRKQNDEIRKLESAVAAKESEIAAAKKAEEEARKAQEEALRKQAEEEANGGSSSYGGSSASGSSSSRSYASASSYSGSGGKGQQIANYACQFIGNPYVAGGTSLTDGADCSGFVFRVYKDFGYSVPRTSYALRNAGTGVSYGEAQPGDVICYAGHVGIYIGNGQIVHASTPASGIKINGATYKEILAVRRIV